jgi:hypothetical protein
LKGEKPKPLNHVIYFRKQITTSGLEAFGWTVEVLIDLVISASQEENAPNEAPKP